MPQLPSFIGTALCFGAIWVAILGLMYSVVCGLNFVPLAIRLPLLGGIILPYLLHYDYLTLRYPTKGYPLFLGAFYLLVAFLASFINWVFYAIIELLINYSWEYIMTLYNLAVLWFIMWLLFWILCENWGSAAAWWPPAPRAEGHRLTPTTNS